MIKFPSFSRLSSGCKYLAVCKIETTPSPQESRLFRNDAYFFWAVFGNHTLGPSRLWCYSCHETDAAHKWPWKLSIQPREKKKTTTTATVRSGTVCVSSAHQHLQGFTAATSACVRGRLVLAGLHVSVCHFKDSSFITKHKNAFVGV